MEENNLNKNNAYVSLKNINKVYPNGVHAVYDFNLDVQKNEFVVFVGPSGCGKSTTLRMIAGLEEITSGELYIDGVYSNENTPKDRDIAMVFQSYALYPHMTVYDNIGFGLKIRHTPKDEINRRVKEAAKILELTNYLDRKPKELSGGQRQRVALGRAIVRKAKVFLMDEPLSNLDAKLRLQMRSEIVRIHEQLGVTTIYVTHDQTEAMTMASRIVVMKDGYIQQIGTPIEIYNHPANMFVAGFIGAPVMNFINSTLTKDTLYLSNELSIKMKQDEIDKISAFYKNKIEFFEEKLKEIKEELVHEEKGKKVKKLIQEHESNVQSIEDELNEYKNVSMDNLKLVYGIRPEDVIEPDDRENNLSNQFQVKVVVAELLGNEYHIHSDFNDKDFVAKIPMDKIIRNGDNLAYCFKLDKGHIFDPISGETIF